MGGASSVSCARGGSPSEAIKELVQLTTRLGESNSATSSQTGAVAVRERETNAAVSMCTRCA